MADFLTPRLMVVTIYIAYSYFVVCENLDFLKVELIQLD